METTFAKNLRIGAVIFICSLIIALPIHTHAADDVVSNVDIYEFRETYINYLTSSNEATGMDNQVVTDTITKVENLTEEELTEFVNTFPDPEKFLDLLKNQIAPPAATTALPPAATTTALPAATTTATSLYDPDYGSNAGGSDYKTCFLDHLSASGYISSNTANAERCDNEAFADLVKTLTGFRIASVAGSAACDLGGCDPTGVACLVACVIGDIIDAGTEVAELLLASCDGHNGTVDGAEIEAAYENTKIIAGQLDNLDADLATHDTDIKALLATMMARQLEVIRLLHTPQGLRSTDVPACNGGGCNWPEE